MEKDVVCPRCESFIGQDFDVCPVCGKSLIGDDKDD